MSQRLTLAVLALLLSGCTALPGAPAPADMIDSTSRAAAEQAEAGYDYAASAKAWGTLHERHPDDPAITLKLASNLRYSGQTQAAIDLALGFVESHGRAPALVTELGKDYLAADRLGPAVRTLTEAAALLPNDWQVPSALAVALDYQGHYDEAQQAYRRALALSPDNPVVLNNLGLSQAQAGHLGEAVASLEKAADQPHASAQVRQNLALLRALQGDLAGAERLNRQDLPPDMVRDNAAYYRLLSGPKLP